MNFYASAVAVSIIAALALLAAPHPAFAQMGGGSSQAVGGSGMNQPTMQPKPPAPDFNPAAVPGAAAPALAVGPVSHKPITGDPTTALFAAVNNNDYNAAQDAVSRGADINAQNNLGETPLDLSIALNRNTITFMLLSARNEGGGSPPAGPTITAASVVTQPLPPMKPTAQAIRATRAAVTPRPYVTTSNTAAENPGTPNPAAGFLGFGPTK